VPERAGVRGRLVVEADISRYLAAYRDIILPDGSIAAGEVRLAKNIAAWLAIGGINPNIDGFTFHCCDDCNDDSSSDDF
jgi:hypothetical protein